MKRNVAIALIIAAVVLCTCPLLVFGGGSLYASSSPEIMATVIANGQNATGIAPQSTPVSEASIASIIGGCTICLGVIIPLIVGLITLRKSRNNAAGSLPPQ